VRYVRTYVKRNKTDAADAPALIVGRHEINDSSHFGNAQP
jgi:hypothetical protein